MIKKINLIYEGEVAYIDAALDALAAIQGWSEDAELAKSEEERITKEQAASNFVNNCIRNAVSVYSQDLAAKQAREAAKDAATSALDAVNRSLIIEEI